MLTNPRGAFRGQSRSPNIVPFHMLDSFLLVFCGNFVPKFEIFDFKNAVTLKMSSFDRAHTTSYWCSLVTMVLSGVVSEIFNVEKWNPGQRSLKIIATDTYRSATYDFLLTFHSNHGPISYRFRDKRGFQWKITNFSHPRLFCALTEWVPRGIGYREMLAQLCRID